MPKTSNYANCMFYRLVCRDPSIKEVYVGHTCNEVKRRNCHKTRCNNEKGPKYNYFVYKFIRDHGSWDNWQLIVHETLAVENKAAAVLRERFWFEHYNATLNSNVPGRTELDKLKYGAEYYAAHIKEMKKYRVEHRDVRNQQSAAWAAANEAYSKEKHDCFCHGRYSTANRSTHLKSKKHLAAVAAAL